MTTHNLTPDELAKREAVKAKAQASSKEHGCSQHVNYSLTWHGNEFRFSFYASDWYGDNTIYSFDNGLEH